ncbi:Uncharacterised protein [Mycobacterium tuberculosis]|nr:Uncharacterised protein [Mycobacterium tuberculosis]
MSGFSDSRIKARSLVTTTTVAQSASASDQPVDLGYSDR